jgi:hypothetical protein
MYLQAFQIIAELVGSHVHIHNPNIATRLATRFKKYYKQLGIPAKGGMLDFPDETDEKAFLKRPEIHAYASTLNCQPVRNFVIESVILISLSHQKEMTLPRIKPSNVTLSNLCKEARRRKIGGSRPEKMAEKNALNLAFEVVKKLIFYKTPKTEDAIYWILWTHKYNMKFNKKLKKSPCRPLHVQGVARVHSDHWVWYMWKILLSRVAHYPDFKKRQIVDIYYLFKIGFSKTSAVRKLPLMFFAIRLLKYDLGNNFPAVINQLHLHVQACANVNILYRNLQIRLARKSWTSVCDPIEVERVKTGRKNGKLTKTEKKEEESKLRKMFMDKKMAYLEYIPRIRGIHRDH